MRNIAEGDKPLPMAFDVNALPVYACHKRVRAAKITDWRFLLPEKVVLELEGGSEATVCAQWFDAKRPRIGGYFVVYADGYESYSPAGAFELGYSKIEEGGSGGHG